MGSPTRIRRTPSLLCVEHNANDGLLTSAEGMQHSVLVKVPVSLMDKAGEYRFVISARDSHADREKGHRQKWALERNVEARNPSLALIALDETRLGRGTINHTGNAHTARGFLMRQIWDRQAQEWRHGYKPWETEGQPQTGGSGLIVMTDGLAPYVLHTLNRRHAPASEPRRWAHPNAIWGFFGHANPKALGIPGGGRGGLTIDTRLENRGYYNISDVDMDWMRLAFLQGCNTAGGHSEHKETNYHSCDLCSRCPCPSTESIAYRFYLNGADCVVGFKGSQYAGPTFAQFNYSFWYYLHNGMTVIEALKEAKDDLGWMYFLRKKDDPYFAVTDRLMVWGDTVLAPPGYGR